MFNFSHNERFDFFKCFFPPASDWQESSLDEDAGKQALIGCQYECKLIKRFEGQFGSELEL